MQSVLLLEFQDRQRDETLRDGANPEPRCGSNWKAGGAVSLPKARDPENVVLGYQRYAGPRHLMLLHHVADALLQLLGRLRRGLLFLVIARTPNCGEAQEESAKPRNAAMAIEPRRSHQALPEGGVNAGSSQLANSITGQMIVPVSHRAANVFTVRPIRTGSLTMSLRSSIMPRVRKAVESRFGHSCPASQGRIRPKPARHGWRNGLAGSRTPVGPTGLPRPCGRWCAGLDRRPCDRLAGPGH